MNYRFRLRVLNEIFVTPVYVTVTYEFVPMSHLFYAVTYKSEHCAVVDYNTAMALCNFAWTMNKGVIIPEVIEDEE